MKDIDWSKAPEWAEYAVIGPLSGALYFANDHTRQRDHDCFLFHVGKGGAVSHINDGWSRIERPSSEWTGQGLPPVGTVCEVSAFHINNGEWTAVKVLANAKHENDECMLVAQFNEGKTRIGRMDGVVYTGNEHSFRPIRTTEQIAAEERQNVVGEMLALFGGTDSRDTYLMQRLYDAGYRKQEQPK